MKSKLTLKNIVMAVFGIFTVKILYSTKQRIKDLIDISKQLQYRLVGLPYDISITNRSINIDLGITNPTELYLNAKNISIKNIQLRLQDGSIIARALDNINDIEIPPNSEKIIKKINVKITISLAQIIPLIKNFNNIKVYADITAFGHKVISI